MKLNKDGTRRKKRTDYSRKNYPSKRRPNYNYRHKVQPGDRFGKLTAIEFSHREGKKGIAFYKFKCDCGNITVKNGTSARRGHTQSCGCNYDERWLKNINLFSKEQHKTHLFNRYKKAAKNRNLSFNLDKEDFDKFLFNECLYCSETNSNKCTLKSIKGPIVLEYNGIDRIDSSLGYFNENCITACVDCNRSKFNYDINFFLNHVENVYLYRFCSINAYEKEINKLDIGNLKYLSAMQKVVFDSYRKGAISRDLSFLLTYDEVQSIVQQKCYYCGHKGTNTRNYRRKGQTLFTYITNGIDRVDPTKGYELDNVRCSCKYCNKLKLAKTEQEFLNWIQRIHLNRLSGKFNHLLKQN